VSVRRLLPLLPAVVALSACGGGDDETALLGRTEARELRDDLAQVEQRVAAGDCQDARFPLQRLRQQVAELPEIRDAALRERLGQGVENLERAVERDCAETETTETATTQTTPTQTVPPETTPPATTPTETAPPQTTPPQTTPPQTTPQTLPQQPETPVDPGGEEAPGEELEE
jgi:hypothetical protein